jgi:hypothetical protein
MIHRPPRELRRDTKNIAALPARTAMSPMISARDARAMRNSMLAMPMSIAARSHR